MAKSRRHATLDREAHGRPRGQKQEGMVAGQAEGRRLQWMDGGGLIGWKWEEEVCQAAQKGRSTGNPETLLNHSFAPSVLAGNSVFL